MRIISGSLKGRLINNPNDKTTKATMQRVKESTFSIINDQVKESTFLDLFAGSGSISYEAISRGAKQVVMVDNNYLVIKHLNKLKELFNTNNATIIKSDYTKYLKTTNLKFDIIYLDPPYDLDIIPKILELININNLLNKKGIIIIECTNIPEININFKIISNKKYSNKHVIILEYKEN